MEMLILHFLAAESDVRQERVLKDKNSIIQMKVIEIPKFLYQYFVLSKYCYQDDEIAELKAKMDDMAEEFGEMLRVCVTLAMDRFFFLLLLNRPIFYLPVCRKRWRKCVSVLKSRPIASMVRSCRCSSALKSSKCPILSCELTCDESCL